MNNKLQEMLNDPEYAELFEVSKEEQELHDSLFNSPRLKTYKKQSLNESLSILGYSKEEKNNFTK